MDRFRTVVDEIASLFALGLAVRFRGGGFGSGAIGVRGAVRFSGGTPSFRADIRGFRCARTP